MLEILSLLNEYLRSNALPAYLTNFALILIGSLTLLVIIFSFYRSSQTINLLAAFNVTSVSLCLLYLFMDAPDVALTEAAIGAALSSCIILVVLKDIEIKTNKTSLFSRIASGALCISLAGILAIISLELPDFGSEEAPAHTEIGNYYLQNTYREIGIHSPVAAILASYRGIDTLGETVVIFVAALSVQLIFAHKKRVLDSYAE